MHQNFKTDATRFQGLGLQFPNRFGLTLTLILQFYTLILLYFDWDVFNVGDVSSDHLSVFNFDLDVFCFGVVDANARRIGSASLGGGRWRLFKSPHCTNLQ